MNEERPFPDEDVAACVSDAELQRAHFLEDVTGPYAPEMEEMRQRALALGASTATYWLYFQSPPRTWRAECGREGWLLHDPESGCQHEFVMTAMS